MFSSPRIWSQAVSSSPKTHLKSNSISHNPVGGGVGGVVGAGVGGGVGGPVGFLVGGGLGGGVGGVVGGGVGDGVGGFVKLIDSAAKASKNASSSCAV